MIYPFLLLLSFFAFAQSEEQSLMKACSSSDLSACENLTAFYIRSSKWESALGLGEALCNKEIVKGCTFAGTAALAKNMNREGISFLTRGCDGFEPYACRSLSRLMKKNNEREMSFMYMKRACYYGLRESCHNLAAPIKLYSAAAQEFLKSVDHSCEETSSESCKERLSVLGACQSPLSKLDCFLITGELSILFRAKLIQEGAKLVLLSVLAAQKLQKENPKINRYSYDLKLLFKDQKQQASYHYAFGFMKACTTKFERNRKAESTSLTLYKDAYKELPARTKKNMAALFFKDSSKDCYEPTIGFEAFAAANLDPMNPSRLDVWKINRDGNILQLQDGLPKR